MSSKEESESASTQPPAPSQSQRFAGYLRERFGILLPEGIALEGEKSLRVMNSELANFRTSTPKGIPASRMKGKFPKPSTAFMQIFGSLATKNALSLSREDALSYLHGEDFTTGSTDLETGYVALTYNGATLGVGFYKEGKIENMLPKGRRIMKK